MCASLGFANSLLPLSLTPPSLWHSPLPFCHLISLPSLSLTCPVLWSLPPSLHPSLSPSILFCHLIFVLAAVSVILSHRPVNLSIINQPSICPPHPSILLPPPPFLSSPSSILLPFTLQSPFPSFTGSHSLLVTGPQFVCLAGSLNCQWRTHTPTHTHPHQEYLQWHVTLPPPLPPEPLVLSLSVNTCFAHREC